MKPGGVRGKAKIKESASVVSSASKHRHVKSVPLSKQRWATQQSAPPGTADSSRGVRVVVNGVDVTPLPLVSSSSGRTPTPSLAATEEGAPPSGVPLLEKEVREWSVPAKDEFSEVEVNVQDEDESRDVYQMLVESKTEWLLCVPGACVATDFSGKKAIEERNALYAQKLEEKQKNSDRFASRHAQTLNGYQKDAASTAKPPTTAEAGAQAANWDIYDAENDDSEETVLFVGGGEEKNALEEDLAAAAATSSATNKGCLKWQSHLEKALQKATALAFSSKDFLLDVSEANFSAPSSSGDRSTARFTETSFQSEQPQPTTQSADHVLLAQQATEVLASESLASSLARVERCVQQNVFHEKQLRYRNRESAADVSDDDDESDDDEANDNATLKKVPSFTSSTTHKDDEASSQGKKTIVTDVTPRREEEEEDEAKKKTATKKEESLGLETLWTWRAPMTRGRSVTSMCWNQANEDILAVGYGDHGYEQRASSSGLVLFWSLRNPVFPELALEFTTGCTALDFSKKSPHLLAVGFKDGTVAAYNVRTVGRGISLSNRETDNSKENQEASHQSLVDNSNSNSSNNLMVFGSSGSTANDKSRHRKRAWQSTTATGTTSGGRILATPVMDSSQAPGKHMDPVWQVQWVDKGERGGETLVSISTDGRVVEWPTRKGLEETTLMVLKRVGNSEGVISRQAAGLCLDFTPEDPSIYFAATEDGLLHRCSSSYNEQYLETYAGHSGPVYSVKCNPFWSPAFLSCSADWTLKLWHQHKPQEINSFHSVDLNDGVHDLAWSPTNATIFASVAGDGRVELWDLSISTLDPIVTRYTERTVDRDVSSSIDPPQSPRGDTGLGNGGGGGGLENNNQNSRDAASLPLPPNNDTDINLPPPSSTAVLFATTAPVLVVGDALGSVTCYRINGLNLTDLHLSKDQQIANLKAAMFPEAKV